MQNYDQAFSYVQALTQQDPNLAIMDWRTIHDTNKEVPAHNYRGTLSQLWETLVSYNNSGYGVFCNINCFDDSGNKRIENVVGIRCQACDFDNLSALQNFERAAAWYPAPTFGVETSPGKFHTYWVTEPHNNLEQYGTLQRKLRQWFDSDKSIIDPTRVLRVPGFYHLKGTPHLVRCFALGSYGRPIAPAILDVALMGVNVMEGFGDRKPLGDPALAAPGSEWLQYALNNVNPNTLPRHEWISYMAAFKQAGWSYFTEQQLWEMFSRWCENYDGNDPGENWKAWQSIRDTEVGWAHVERKTPGLLAARMHGHVQQQMHSLSAAANPMPHETTPGAGAPLPETLGEFLTPEEQAQHFKDCVFVSNLEKMLTPGMRFMGSSGFNGTYGGKKFVIDGEGKITDEAWKAATRGMIFKVPVVDHTRFIPTMNYGEIVTDTFGRKGVNTFVQPIINSSAGDVSLFLRHMELLIPNELDRKILLDFFAHNVKYPGHKIPWAPLIQSVEGAGKGMIKALFRHALGLPYCYFPNAHELASSGSKFNAWMRAKLFILVDEIKVGERFELIEILKPMISEREIEIQGKGVDQSIEDNYSNWLFFSNYKDAIPANKNARRFSMFFSPLQNKGDLHNAGMTETYFKHLYGWMNEGGASHVTHWLKHYPIEQGAIPMTAPITTSTAEALRQSRGPVEVAILDAIEDGVQGFRQGWVSSLAVARVVKGAGHRAISIKRLHEIMEGIGYHHVGRATRPHREESVENRAELFCVDRNAQAAWYGDAQGYVG